MKRLLAVCFGWLLLLVPGCASPPPPPSPGSGDGDFVLVTLLTGPRSAELTAAQRQEVFAGHMANMQRLAAQRRLLVAGPYGAEKHDPALRGLFVFDVPGVDQARELAATDPGVQAGVFATALLPLRGPASLRRVPDVEQERLAARARLGAAAGEDNPMRGYVLLTAHDAAQADAALAAPGVTGRVLWAGRLGGEPAGRGLYLLDATDVAAARQAFGPALEDLGTLDAWWSTKSLEALAPHARGRRCSLTLDATAARPGG